MHEWALADAVIEATSSALAGPGIRACLRGVSVLIGELQAIDREIFDFALKTMLEERPFRSAVYGIQYRGGRLSLRKMRKGMDALRRRKT